MPGLMLMLTMVRLSCITATVISADAPEHLIKRYVEELDVKEALSKMLKSWGSVVRSGYDVKTITLSDLINAEYDGNDSLGKGGNTGSVEKRFTRNWIDMIGHEVSPRKEFTKARVADNGMPMLHRGFLGKRTHENDAINDQDSNDFTNTKLMDARKMNKKQAGNNGRPYVEFPSQLKIVEGPIEDTNNERFIGTERQQKRDIGMPILHYLPAIQSRFQQQQKQFSTPILHGGGIVGKRNRNVDSSSGKTIKLLVKVLLAALASDQYERLSHDLNKYAKN